MSLLAEDDGDLPPAKAPVRPIPTFSQVVDECNGEELIESVYDKLVEKYKMIMQLKVEGFQKSIANSFVEMLDKVAYIMTIHPSTKGSYSLLYFYYLKYFTALEMAKLPNGQFAILTRPEMFEDFVRCGSPETPARARRLWKRYGFFKDTTKTEAKRELREQEFRNMIPKITLDMEEGE